MKLLTAELTEKLNKAGADGIVPICKSVRPVGCRDLAHHGNRRGHSATASLTWAWDAWNGVALPPCAKWNPSRDHLVCTIERDLFWTPKPGMNYFELDSLAGYLIL